MKNLIVLVGLVWQLGIPVKLIAQSTQSKNMEKEVTATHLMIINAIKKKKGDLLKELIKDNFTFTSATAEVWNRDKFLDGFVLNPIIAFRELTSHEGLVTLHGNTAILTALFYIEISRQPGAVPDELWERVTETYISTNAKWQLVAMQATFLPKK